MEEGGGTHTKDQGPNAYVLQLGQALWWTERTPKPVGDPF